MNILGFVLLGLLAGWLAGHIMKGRGFGFFGNIIVGSLGALCGGLLFDVVGLEAYGFLGSLVMATFGAVTFLFLISLFTRRKASL